MHNCTKQLKTGGAGRLQDTRKMESIIQDYLLHIKGFKYQLFNVSSSKNTVSQRKLVD